MKQNFQIVYIFSSITCKYSRSSKYHPNSAKPEKRELYPRTGHDIAEASFHYLAIRDFKVSQTSPAQVILPTRYPKVSEEESGLDISSIDVESEANSRKRASLREGLETQ